MLGTSMSIRSSVLTDFINATIAKMHDPDLGRKLAERLVIAGSDTDEPSTATDRPPEIAQDASERQD
jgi:hypothetical protein